METAQCMVQLKKEHAAEFGKKIQEIATSAGWVPKAIAKVTAKHVVDAVACPVAEASTSAAGAVRSLEDGGDGGVGNTAVALVTDLHMLFEWQ